MMKNDILLTVFVWLLILGTGCNGPKKEQPESDQSRNHRDTNSETEKLNATAIEKGVDYLFKNQSAQDSLWHSEQYGNLKSGAAISSLVVFAISQSSFDLPDEKVKQLQKCIDRLGESVAKKGYVSNPDGPDYSNYASAYLLLSAKSNQLTLDSTVRFQLIDYLCQSQLDEEEGTKEKDPDYGGWDLSGWMRGQRPTTGTNVSVTSVVLSALAEQWDWLGQSDSHRDQKQTASRRIAIEQCFKKAEVWCRQCQRADGGFCFHPEQAHQGNKAGWLTESAEEARSYGSATADGLSCLRSLQCVLYRSGQTQPNRVAAKIALAQEWLSPYLADERVPGFTDPEAHSSWAIGLRFYYWMSISRNHHQLDRKLVGLIESLQKDDGSWENPNARMREDDPLIATSFAVIALANAKRSAD